MPDTLEFDLVALERIFHDGFRPVTNGLNGLHFEVSIGPDFLAALLANKHRFIRHVVSPSDPTVTCGAIGPDLNGCV